MIGMPPTTGMSMDDYGACLGALAAVTSARSSWQSVISIKNSAARDLPCHTPGIDWVHERPQHRRNIASR
jgi:hypothetical protein